MKCAIPTISDVDLDIAVSAAVGNEWKLYYSRQPVRVLGEIDQDAADSGVYTADRTYTALNAGRDLQVVCLDSVQSDEAIVAALAVTLSDGTSGSGVAVIAPAATSPDQDFDLPGGIAVDLKLWKAGVDVSSTLKVRTVNSLLSVSGGGSGNRLGIISCPELDTYNVIACVTNRDIEVPTAKSIAIPCGYDGARWTKKGRSAPPKADLKANYTAFGNGLARINGQRVTVMMELRKDDKVLTERMIIGGYRPEIKFSAGDGDAVAEATATGMFESGKFAVFV